MPATDRFSTNKAGLTAPLETGEAVTPHDTNELTYASRALYVGTTGNLAVVMVDGTALTLSSVPVGLHPLRVKQVKSTGTTASNIVALS